MSEVELTHAPEREKSHQCMPNRRALLLGCVNNWANEVRPSASNNTPQNSAASDSQTGGKSYPPSSTVPSLTTKATSVSSATSDVAPEYRRTPAPVSNGSPVDEDKDGTQDATPLPARIAGHHRLRMSGRPTSANVNPQESDDDCERPISKAAWTGTKRKRTGYPDFELATPEAAEADDEGSGIDHSDEDIYLQQLAKVPHVTAMTNVIASNSTKKPRTSQHGDMTVGGSRQSASAAAYRTNVFFILFILI
ncbi:hypothetical protein EDD15DRAFT_2193093 [Pisolithus albus]|nr:hypothetical protein EDD15DRAFT_2193093 [Pisolithus albus]